MNDTSPALVHVPADVDRPDKILAGLTARQTAIAALAAVITLALYEAARRHLPPQAAAVLAAVPGLAGAALVLIERDGLPLDRLLAAALRFSLGPRRLVPAPGGLPAPPAAAAGEGPGPAVLPPLWRHVTPEGITGCADGSQAAIAAVSTVNFALRSPAEQAAVTSAYGRWLNSLAGPVQIIVRAGHAGLPAAAARLREAAPGLPHPALERAAREHAAFLEDLAAGQVITRQALLVVREPPPPGPARPGGGEAGAVRAARRAAEGARLLAAAGLTARVLDGGQVTALLSACADPAAPAPPGRLAVPGRPVTAGAGGLL